MSSPILKRISKMPEEIPKDVGFREITKEDINKFYKELKNDDFWGTEEELFELLDN